MKSFLICLFLFELCHSYAQNSVNNMPVSRDVLINSTELCYKLEYKKEFAILTPATALFITALLLEPKTISAEELNSLNPENIPGFERQLIHFDSASAYKKDIFSDYTAAFTYCIGAGSVFIGLLDKNNGQIIAPFVMYSEGLLLTSGITEILKKSVGRIRPYAYNTNYSDAYRTDAASTLSFPSGHTSSSAFNCFFAAKMIDDFFIEDDAYFYKTVNWTLAGIIPVYVGYLRTQAGKHFTTDVIGGYVIGAACGYLIPELHKNSSTDFSLYPSFRDDATCITFSLIF